MNEDAGTAIETVQERLIKTQTVFSFEVEKVELIELAEKKYWSVQCSFFPSLLADDRVTYTVLVDAETNKIYQMQKEAK